MIDNELQVRLLHAAKTKDQWKAVTSYPKKGEVCLEAINTSGATAFKIKIGDGTRPYCRNTGTTQEPVWDFTSEYVLPYFGSIIEASGNLQVAGYYTYPNDYETVLLRNVTVIRFYQLSLTTTAGKTTLSIDSDNYKEVRAGNKLNITHTSGDNYGKINHDGITTVISDNSSVVDEKDSDVITSLTTDGYGHITAYSKDKSSNMLAADLKGAVEQTDANKTWRYRVTGDTISIKEDTASLNKLDGNTIVWNQLVDTNTSSITLTSGNKYVTIIDGTKSLITGDSSSISVTGGTDCIFDLTKMFGSGNEPDLDTFEKLFSLPYYAYNEGQLLNVNVNGLKTVGFNQWDEEWESGYISNTGVESPRNTAIRSKNYFKCVPGATYYLTAPSDSATSIKWYDASKSFLGQSNQGAIVTAPGNAAYLRISSYGYGSNTYNHDICINLSDPSRDGTYEPYWSDTTSVPITGITGISSATSLREVVFPDGLKSAGTAKDSIEGNTAYKRLDIRDYESGDESDSSVITDGTHTIKALSPIITYTRLQYPDGRPFTLPINYRVDDLGTEEWLPEQTASAPIGYPVSTITYKSNFKDAVLDTIDKVNNYKNPVQGESGNEPQTVGKVVIYDTDHSTVSSDYSVIDSESSIDPDDTSNDTIIPTVDKIVDYVEDNTVQEITTSDTGTSGLEVTQTNSSWDVSHQTVKQSSTDDGASIESEAVVELVTGVNVDRYGHVTGKHTISSDKIIAADIKAPVKETDDSTWNYRETGGEDITIGEDTAKIPSLKGNTIVWNQILNDSYIINSSYANTTLTKDGSKIIINGTASSTYDYSFYKAINWKIGHKYILRHSGSDKIKGAVAVNNIYPSFQSNGDKIITVNTVEASAIFIEVTSGVTYDNVSCYFNIFDLTLMFGETVANSMTVDEFEKLFPNSYYPYCESRLVNLGGYGVKWNQLVQNGNFEDGTTHWTPNSVNTISASDNVLTITSIQENVHVYASQEMVSGIIGHKVLYSADVKASVNTTGTSLATGSTAIAYHSLTANQWTTIKEFVDNVSSDGFRIYMDRAETHPVGTVLQVRNAWCIDLTQMFGPGSEPTLEEFEAMFPDDYYEYNAGTEMNIFDAIGGKKLGLISTGDIPDESEPHAVDMGLPSGLLWADSDIDITQEDGFAASPYQYGCTMFSWGNVEGHNTPATGTTFDYNWGGVNADEPYYEGQPYGNTKGNTLSGDIPVGEEYDAARANIGSPWRMPTTAEFVELFAGCIYIDADGVEVASDKADKRVTVNGIVGLYLQSKTNGNRIFFACSGDGAGSSWYSCGTSSYYWSSSFRSSRNARGMYFGSGGVNPQDSNGRYYGFAVRPVRYKKQTLDLDWIREIEYTPSGSSTPEKLFPYGLLSAGSVHDEVTETKAIKRLGSVNLGSLSWEYITGDNARFKGIPTISAKSPDNTNIPNAICTKYSSTTYTVIYAATGDKQFAIGGDSNFYIRDTAYTDAATFKSAMNGVLLYYELATPVEIPLAETHRMSYLVDDHGTEQQLPINVSSVINAPFVGTFQYLSNFKDTVLDIIDKVNSYKNPVKSKDNVSQTVGKFATYDTSYTVHSSEYQVKNNPFEGAETAITLPTAEQIIEYVNTQIASSLTYKGVVSGLTGSTSGKIYFSGISNPSSGDLYFLGNLDDSATSMVVDSTDSSTYHIAEGTYYPGTMFIWNADTVGSEHWDAIAGTTTVSDGNPTLWVDEGTPVPDNRTQYTVGSIEGHDLHVTVPEIEEIAGKKTAGQVLVGNGTDKTDGTATWRGLKLDETVDNSSIPAKISTLGTGVLERYDNGSGDNHDYQWRFIEGNFDANQKLENSQFKIPDNTTVSSVPHIYKSENIELNVVKNSSNDNVGFSTYVPLLSKSNGNAVIGTVLAGNYDINSGTHDALPSWRNLKLDELSCDGTNLVPSLGTGFLKREGSDSWSITNNLLTWKLSPDPFNLKVTTLTTDNTGLLNKIYNYTGVTTIQQLSHTSGSNTVIDGFRVNVPLITDPLATPGKVLTGNYPSLPSWQNVSMENISEILSQTAGNEGYLKRTATNSGTEQEPNWTYGWELDPYGGGSLKPSYADNTAVEASEDRQTAPSAPNAGLREQTGTSTYKHYKVPFSAIENDPSTGNNAVVIILNGNFS